MRSEGYGMSVVCCHVFSDYAQRDNETTIPTGSSLNWLKRRFSYNYCVQKLWREKQAKKPICNEYSLTAALLQRPLAGSQILKPPRGHGRVAEGLHFSASQER